MLDADLRLPMVDSADVGAAATELLTRDAPATGISFVEGPARYTPADVAAAFGSALGRPVEVTVTPRDGWVPAFREMGVSAEAAESYAGMTAVTVDGDLALPESPTRGATTLPAYIDALVKNG
jgi:uncharacterized protein YbjT (DUF2867 family)